MIFFIGFCLFFVLWLLGLVCCRIDNIWVKFSWEILYLLFVICDYIGGYKLEDIFLLNVSILYGKNLIFFLFLFDINE